ncbi:MAG: response regulator [Betaproteobacteria bacterium]|nr:MAG: response regulator [Betaproteobacteria bacterium]
MARLARSARKSREGYDALHAATVKDGLDRVAAEAPDVVITDLKLPDGTGLDVIQHLHSQQPELPLILITSYSSLDSAIGALRAGAIDYLIKPFENEDLLRAVRRAVRIKRAPPLAVEAYMREVVQRFQDSHSEIELARMLGIGRKALWMRRRQWGLKRPR